MSAKLNAVDVKIKFPYLFELTGKWFADEAQQQAAWELYVELVTRIATVRLGPEEGLIREAFTSLHQLFPTTRDVLRRAGPGAAKADKKGALTIGAIAVSVLNHGIRPLLARWHPELADWEAQKAPGISPVAHERAWARADDVRGELERVQSSLQQYAGILELALGLKQSLIESPPE